MGKKRHKHKHTPRCEMNSATRVLLYGSNLWYLGDGMLGPLFAVFAQRVGGSVLDITWAWTVYLLLSGVLNMLFGRISDGRYKEYLMVAGYFAMSLFTFAYLWVSTPLHLFFVQAGLGLASAMSGPTWQSLYAKYNKSRHDGFVWGLASGEAQIFTCVAIVIGGLVVTYYSFDALFITMGSLQLVAAIYQAQLLWMDIPSRLSTKKGYLFPK